MSEVTIKAIEHLLDKKLDEKLDEKLDAKFDAKLKPIQQGISAINTGMVNLATQESLNGIAGRLATIEEILNQHTSSLDAIA
ncbi:MAG: hypothetical protein P4L74_00285 [Candidatus Doudnabacteria bacterium]|nr:hypothetical protein [Candidatus Doudnabacteria bacterium]